MEKYNKTSQKELSEVSLTGDGHFLLGFSPAISIKGSNKGKDILGEASFLYM
jgi:hypothetical protein